MLTGSMAMGLYVVPRYGDDFDFIADLHPTDAEKFAGRFGGGYEWTTASLNEAVQYKTGFSILDATSAWRAHFLICKDGEHHNKSFERKQWIDANGLPLAVATAEDLLIAKLIHKQDCSAGVRTADAVSFGEAEGLDTKYVGGWLRKFNKTVPANDGPSDTPLHVRTIQRNLWLARTPGHRLRQQMISNHEMRAFWQSAREQLARQRPSSNKEAVR